MITKEDKALIEFLSRNQYQGKQGDWNKMLDETGDKEDREDE